MYEPHLLVWLLLSLVTAVDDDPYCGMRYRRLCQGKGQHVACMFPESGPGESCENYTMIQFTDDLKRFILRYINRRRQKIASGNEKVRGGLRLPKPELMMFVLCNESDLLMCHLPMYANKTFTHQQEWDRELAFLAQRLADQCRFVHDDCRATVRYPYAGQSVGEVRWRKTGESTEYGAKRAIMRVFDAWWGERRRVEPRQLTSPFRLTSRGAVWGHFSQLAVWTLQALGCGAVHHGTSRPRLLIVCDFSHTNMLGQRTITPGPLAPCPIHTIRIYKSSYPLLCAPIPRRMIETNNQEYDDGYDNEEGMGVEIDDEEMLVKDIPVEETTTLQTKPVFRSNTKRIMEERVHTAPRTRSYRPRPTQRTRETDDGTLPVVEIDRKWFLNRQDIDQEEESEHFHEVIPLGAQLPVIPRYDPNDVLSRHRPDPLPTSPKPFLRQRWKQTRDRPLRPGANALISRQPAKNSKKESASFKMDQEDVEQLFRDTGFKVAWKV